MNFDTSETQRMLLDSAERLMKSRTSVEQWRARRALPDGLDQAGWAQFAELGWLALAVPEDAGGIGGSMEDVALLMMALGKGLAVEPYVSTAVLGLHLIDRAGGAHREELLCLIAAGETRIALAHAEIGDRYETDTRRATTARTFDNGFILNGTKTLVFDAPSAERLIVSARLDGAEGTALFLVDADTPGLICTGYPMIDGSHAADIRLEDVRLTGDALLAEGHAGSSLLDEAIDRASVALMAQAVGSMEACLEVCSAYIKERKQFGVPIGSFQSLQHLIVDMLISTHQSRSILYYALAHLDGDATERNRAVSSAKLVAGEAMQLVSRTAVQLHGGYGLTDEYAISHHFKRLQVLEKAYGDIDYHQRRLARLPLAVE